MTVLPKLVIAANFWHLDVFGGADKLASELAIYGAQKGCAVYYVSMVSGKASLVLSEKSGVNWYKYPLPKTSGKVKSLSNFITHVLRSRAQVKRILKESGEDREVVINGHSGLQYLGALMGAAGRRGVRKVVSVHSPMAMEYEAERIGSPKNLRDHLAVHLLRLTERYCYRKSDVVQCYSEYTRRLLEKEFPREVAGRLVVCPGYVDLDRFHVSGEAKPALRKRLKDPVWDTQEPVFFCLRRLVPRMGIDHLIEAAAWLRKKTERKFGFKVMIGGEGPLKERLQKFSQDLGLDGTVYFLGRIPDEELPLHYQAADCFVLPTRALECFGLIILESFACGTPVIATPIGSIPEVLGPFSKRSLTDGADPESIGRAMLKFLEAPPPAREELARYASAYGREEILARLASIVMGRDI